ncbi:MAG: hypothetical protein ACRDOH_25870 [Streptosporangiaceae bacterium]
MTLEEIVITGVAVVCVLVTVLVLVLRMSSRRRPGPPHAGGPGRWEERAWSFGPEEDEEYGGAPGHGRPAGYGPPPLWTESPYDPPGWR